jgi:putative nucleotidyltransferase with HDIG domain
MSEMTGPYPDTPAGPPEPRPKSGLKPGVELLIRFHIVTKNARLYETNNTLFQEQVQSLCDSLDVFLKEGQEASFEVRHSALFFNGTRLKFVMATYAIFKYILEEFRVRDIGALTFKPGLTPKDLGLFIAAFGKKEKSEEPPFEKLAADLDAAGVQNIGLQKVLPAETFASLHRDTARVFFLSIVHLKEAFERDRKNEKLTLNTTRRLMQSIFNHLVDNESFLLGLTNLKNFDEYTLNHSVNVCVLALALGRRLGLNHGELVDLGLAAFFHDLGKLDTPLDILNKPAELNDEERDIIERHTHQGAEKLLHLREFNRLPLRAIHVALEHHIKEDLTGYPRYFKRRDVNLFSKIVKVVDFFDAITSKRVYRAKAFTRAEALSLMLQNIGTEFNPLILKSFVHLLGVFPVGTMVALDTGEIGIVFDANPETRFLLRPKVKLITDAEGNRIDGSLTDLAEVDPQTDLYPRTIVKSLDPADYGIEVTDYFLAEAQ